MSTLDEALNPKPSPERLVERARMGETHVRRAVAKNTSAPTSILTLLTGDEDDDVVRAARETLATRSRSTFVWGMGG